jgi:hypothetical protein
MPNHCSPRANCNAMKRDRDDTDFRTVRREYDRTEQGCPFCSISSGDVQLENRLSVEQNFKQPFEYFGRVS